MNKYTVTFKWGLRRYTITDIPAEKSIVAIAKVFPYWVMEMEYIIPCNYTVKVRKQNN